MEVLIPIAFFGVFLVGCILDRRKGVK